MRILFDQGTPHPLRKHFTGHRVDTTAELGWSLLQNGDLLKAAEEAGFEVMVTTDQNLRYQQNLALRRIAIAVLLSTSWPKMQRCVPAIVEVVSELKPGGYVEVQL